MAQTDADTTDASTDNDYTPTDGLTEQVTALHERLDALESDAIEELDDVDLVELRTEIKELEDTVEDARKDTVDAELKTRVEPGETLLGLSHIKSHNKYLKEDAGSVVMRAVSQGIDYTGFVDVNASKVADQHPELAEIGQAEYSYLR
jgi:hypothetical protein